MKVWAGVTLVLSFLGFVVTSPAEAQAPPDLMVSSVSKGELLTGVLAPVDRDRLAGYPAATDPGLGTWPTLGPVFAGTRDVVDATGNRTPTYCVQARVATEVGAAYRPAAWSDVGAPLLGYALRVVQGHYPVNVVSPPVPAGTADPFAFRAAAVQAAVWWFTDGFVLPAGDVRRPAVESIVAAAIAAGPASEPAVPPPTIQGPTQGPAGSLVGPYVTGGAGPASIVPDAGTTVFRDASASEVVAPGALVEPGSSLWILGSGSSAGFSLNQTVQQPPGGGLVDAAPSPGAPVQSLLLAGPREVAAAVAVRVSLYLVGELPLAKVISGSGAGLQGEITITVDCPSTPGLEPWVIPAGASGTPTTVYRNIRIPTTCVVQEQSTGLGTSVELVRVVGRGAAAVCAPGPRAVPPVVLENVFETTTTAAPEPGPTTTAGGPTTSAPPGVTTAPPSPTTASPPVTAPTTTAPAGPDPTCPEGGQPTLPETGNPAEPLLHLVVVLLAAGALLVLLVRRGSAAEA